jgi:hypothetical protein
MVMTTAASSPGGSLYRSRIPYLDRTGKRHVYRVGLECVERRQPGRFRIVAAWGKKERFGCEETSYCEPMRCPDRSDGDTLGELEEEFRLLI